MAAVPVVLALVLLDVALDAWIALLAAGLVAALLGGRRAGRTATALAILTLVVAAACRLHVAWEGRRPASSDTRVAGRLQDLEERKAELVEQVRALARRVATSPDCLPALARDRASLVRLFAGMGDLRRETRRETGSRPSVAVHTYPGLGVVAWSGRLGEPTLPAEVLTRDDDVFVLESTVTTTLVATVAVRGPDGSVRGLVTASLPIAVRRGIDNEYLRDFDLLTGEDPRVEALYVDVREAEGAPAALPPLDPALRARDAVLRAPDGDSLARVRVVSPGPPEVREVLTDRYRRALAVLAALALVAWAAGLGGGPAVVACAVAGWRLAWAAAGTPWPPADATVRSAEVYASPLLGPLTRSPLDFLFTSVAVLVAVACCVPDREAARTGDRDGRPSRLRGRRRPGRPRARGGGRAGHRGPREPGPRRRRARARLGLARGAPARPPRLGAVGPDLGGPLPGARRIPAAPARCGSTAPGPVRARRRVWRSSPRPGRCSSSPSRCSTGVTCASASRGRTPRSCCTSRISAIRCSRRRRSGSTRCASSATIRPGGIARASRSWPSRSGPPPTLRPVDSPPRSRSRTPRAP